MARTGASKSRASKSSGDHNRDGNTVNNTATAWVTFATGAVIVAYLFMTNPDFKSFEAYNFLNTGLCLWLPLMVILFVLKQDVEQFGLARGDRPLGLKWALILWGAMVPFVLFASRMPSFRGYYLARLEQWMPGLGSVYNAVGHVDLKALLYYELAMGFYMFCWEFFFRGFLLFGFLRSKLGMWGAVLLQALPFMLLHWSWRASASKPSPEVFGSLIAALILAPLAIRTRSFIYGYLAHWGVSMTMDICILAPFIFRQFGYHNSM